VADLKAAQGCTQLGLRFRLAQKAFAHTAAYDTAIADYLGKQTADTVAACYQLR
jgi:phosphoribosylaminoimidazolecarboxamide formyltransferase/IMP cyclohydrolase